MDNISADKFTAEHIPVDDHIPEFQMPHDPKTKFIYAFRTISTMLSILQSSLVNEQDEPMTVQDNNDPDSVDQLKVLSALSTLLVRENEAVAVASKRSHSSLELVALSGSSNSVKEEVFHATPNPCMLEMHKKRNDEGQVLTPEDALRCCGQYPAIVQPSKQAKNMQLRFVLRYLTDNW
jgi:hypothetical protein